MSLERAWRISKLTPNSQRNLCLMSFFILFFLRGKNEFGESPNSLQTLSKLKKICVHNFFLTGCTHIFLKKLCAHIFLSLERVRRFSKLIFSSFLQKTLFLKNDIQQRFLCELGVSLEILQTHSKLAPNSYVFIFSVLCFSILFCFF